MTHTIGIDERLARLAPDQRAAATAASGPTLCVAPAGSGKTTTLVARICWLVSEGVSPSSITALTFNRRAAEELTERVAAAIPAQVGASVPAGGGVRIRTFHALGLEILREAGQSVAPLLDRTDVLRALWPTASSGELARLDSVFSRLKLDLGVEPAAIAADPNAGPTARAFVRYEAEIAARGGLDFDDLVARALRLLERDTDVLERWRARCRELLVDEAQDLDRSQLRIGLLLAAPANRIFLVGDDDQSIYGWRLADVRRLLGLAETSLPGLRRVDLEVNYRCPAVVLDRAVRLVEHNRERFAKAIRPRPEAPGRLALVPTADEPERTLDRILGAWPDDGSTRAVLARTNRELLPAVMVALDRSEPFRASGVDLPIEAPGIDPAMDAAARTLDTANAGAGGAPLLAALARVARTAGPDVASGATALLAWAPAYPDLARLRAAVEDVRTRLAALRRDDALLTLATAHGTKGLEFDHVAVIGLDEGRFPSARSIADAEDPDRALEEERRLAYVAWTRARRSLCLVYDPAAPSRFLREAFSSDELRIAPPSGPARSPPARPRAVPSMHVEVAGARPARRGLGRDPGGPVRPRCRVRVVPARRHGARCGRGCNGVRRGADCVRPRPRDRRAPRPSGCRRPHRPAPPKGRIAPA